MAILENENSFTALILHMSFVGHSKPDEPELIMAIWENVNSFTALILHKSFVGHSASLKIL